MDFWSRFEEILNAEPPECYSFMPKEGKALIDAALAIPKEEHEKRIAEYEESVNIHQYAVGGECIRRGYYCPSPIRDIVIGNCKRGRIIKNLARVKQRILYDFGFCDDKLLLIKNRGQLTTEYIAHSEGKQIGYTFDKNMALITVSECIYAGDRLLCYLLADLLPSGNLSSCEKELYEYENGQLQTATWYYQISSICTHNKFVFSHDSEGYLSSYKCIEFANGIEKKNSRGENHCFKVYEKRKV